MDPDKAVFLSYASQDIEAAQRICDGLRDAGLEVWFDRSELRGGDAWDTAIRARIKTCALFLPIISANTNNRAEGYFRLEWKLAVDRSHLMASNKAFLLPIDIDEAKDTDANVPDRFREVQWISLRGGEPTPAFIERVALLLARGGLPENGRQKDKRLGAVTDRAVSPNAPRAARVMFHPGWWFAAAVIGVLGSAAWIVEHRLAEPARIAPYSKEDRRMTFALLPLRPASDETTEAQIAKATGAQTFNSLELNHHWVNLAPAASVTRALAQTAAPKDIATALNVHFLIRGSVSRAALGHTVTLSTVDGETERVLGSVDLPIPPNSLTPRWDDEIDDATGLLVFYGLQVEGARSQRKPDAELDVRDLTFLAWLNWGRQRQANNDKGAYRIANPLLKRALALAPDDPLALYATAAINLCDCVNAWTTNPAEQQSIGEAAIERYLDTHPEDPGMLRRKAEIYQLRGRYAESLVVLDKALKHDPPSYDAMEDKARALLKLGRPKEAAALAAVVYDRHPDDWSGITALIAAIDYSLEDYADAERFAQKSTTQMSRAELSNSKSGAVRLTLIAAAGRLRDFPAAAAGISDLKEAVPSLTSLGSVQKWIHPQADLYGYAPLFEGLRLAGLHD